MRKLTAEKKLRIERRRYMSTGHVEGCSFRSDEVYTGSGPPPCDCLEKEQARVFKDKAQVIIDYANARGSHAHDVRDAAHEAYHAFSVGELRLWEREFLHRLLENKYSRAELWIQEMEARAAEQLVCRALNVKTKSLGDWVMMSCLEAIKRHTPHAEPETSLRIAERALKSDRVMTIVQRILSLETA